MNWSSILSVVTTTVGVIKQLNDLRKDVTPQITVLHNLLAKGQDVTPADLEAIRAQNTAWENELEAEPPPEEA